MELHRFFRYAIEKMCKEKKSLNHFKDINKLVFLWVCKNITNFTALKTKWI